TVRNGNVNEGGVTGVYDASVPGGGVPNGSAIVVAPGHTLVFNVNDVNLYRTEIQAGGVLEIPAGAFDHRLGTLIGEGTLRVVSNTTSVVLPAAYYNDFFACSGGSLNYDGTGNYEIMSSITTVRNLILEGTGTKTLANNDILVCEDLTVTGPAFRNDINNRNVTIGNDLIINNTTATGFRTGTGAISIGHDLIQTNGLFQGSSNANISIASDLMVSGGTFTPGTGGTVSIGRDLSFSGGSFSGGAGTLRYLFNGTILQTVTGDFSSSPANFSRFEIDNTAGVRLMGNVSITGQLRLTNGNVFPGTNQLTLSSAATVVPLQGKSNSFVSGRLYKVLGAGSNFTFPIGKDVLWRIGSVSATSDARTWSMEYFIGNADQSEAIVDNMTPTVIAPPILRMSLGEYWKVADDASPSTARVGLSWGVESDVSANTAERTALKVMAWNDATSSWDSYGGGTFSAGHTQAFGTFVSATPLTFSERIVTLGSTEVANPLPVVFSSFTGSTVGRTNHLFWETASEIDNHYFILERSANGETFEAIGHVDAKGSPGRGVSYHYIDELPFTGRNYYRVKQVDLDGQFEYYDKVVMLTVENMVPSDLDFSMYPNPTSKNSVTLHVAKGNNEPVHVKVFDLSGSVVSETDLQAGDNFSAFEFVFGKAISQGIYMVEVSQGYMRKVKRLVINH
ncbi:MAG TPA: T9SS type A sorting domain-containing protein, partial [Ohtaekwangia sp.]|nr:T9SS type A sorting domain-containing protein [Ohtaekwangia sp.]